MIKKSTQEVTKRTKETRNAIKRTNRKVGKKGRRIKNAIKMRKNRLNRAQKAREKWRHKKIYKKRAKNV